MSYELEVVGPDPLFPFYETIYRTKNGFYLGDAIGGPFVNKWLYEEFEAREDDTYVVSFPKTGTTWAQEIVYLIGNDLDYEKAKATPIIKRFPYLEYKKGIENGNIAALVPPRFIKSHLPYSLLPKSMKEKKCKIVYTIRNPKDTVVSFYHFMKISEDYYKGDFETFFNLFVESKKLGYCPFWKHILETWEIRHQENILILFYEDMKKDIQKDIRRVATFLGKSLTDAQVSQLADHTSFKSMKANPTTNYVKELGKKETEFMRKGEVGDWKNHLTDEMNKKMDDYIEKYFKDSDLKFQCE